jgi:chromosome segregation ATPase
MDDETRAAFDETRAAFDEIRREFSSVRGDLSNVRSELTNFRGEVAGRFEAVDRRLDGLDHKIDFTRESLEDRIMTAARETRDDLGTLIEAFHGDLRTVAEGVHINTTKLDAQAASIGRLRDQVNLRFAMVRSDLSEIQRSGTAPRGRRRPRR